VQKDQSLNVDETRTQHSKARGNCGYLKGPAANIC